VSSELRRRLREEHGSTLLLMPAAVLVLFLLAAITVDAAVLFLGQRRLADMAASVAQDAIAAVDEGSFYADELRLSGRDARARELTLRETLPRDDAFLDPACTVAVSPTEVRADVACVARVRFVFAPGVPGAARLAEVRVSESAVGRRG
jgi:Flp pilus assembly protein TadG